MNLLAINFNFTPPHKDKLDLFKIKEFRGYIRYLFPITLYANSKDIITPFISILLKIIKISILIELLAFP
ncbi:hypothetical protein B11199_00640 [Campylobacter jejuni]|nr:hypothetical protein B10611_06600 [Campylobacter jejuni]GML21138.1 hypothetical protein B10711_03920 [Campylobacter jejuni]GML47505.1 hypothetical protein B11199_00640 [Campylobacter jejuni]GML51371.1 hypothetical protein B11200_00640 [Campylobacter jejuni]